MVKDNVEYIFTDASTYDNITSCAFYNMNRNFAIGYHLSAKGKNIAPSNNTGEAYAILMALKYAEESLGNKKVMILTYSKYVVD